MEVDVEFCMEVVACSLVFYSPELCWEIQLLGIPPFQINFPQKLVSTVVLAAARSQLRTSISHHCIWERCSRREQIEPSRGSIYWAPANIAFPLSLYSLLTKVKTPEPAKSARHASKTGNEGIQLRQHIMLATVFHSTSTSYSSPACNLCQEHPPGHHTKHQQINRHRSPLSSRRNYSYPLCSAPAI